MCDPLQEHLPGRLDARPVALRTARVSFSRVPESRHGPAHRRPAHAQPNLAAVPLREFLDRDVRLGVEQPPNHRQLPVCDEGGLPAAVRVGGHRSGPAEPHHQPVACGFAYAEPLGQLTPGALLVLPRRDDALRRSSESALPMPTVDHTRSIRAGGAVRQPGMSSGQRRAHESKNRVACRTNESWNWNSEPWPASGYTRSVALGKCSPSK